ncbi:MAG: DeoR/GlpR family DNA-binding transcription regulator [Pseudomonadota bacterium]
MAQTFRQKDILTLAQSAGKVTVDGLATHFQVTAQTIRRDLNELCDTGKLTRVHGGAVLPSGVTNLHYEERRSLASDQKDAIGALCATHIPDGVSLFINIGTTTEAVARALANHRNLMVITNNLNVAQLMAAEPTCDVVIAGGVLRRSDGGLTGDATLEFISRFKVDYAVIGASSIDPDGSLLDYDMREVQVSQAIIRNARRTFLVADHTKFTRTAPARIGDVRDLTGFFTDRPPPVEFMDRCEAAGVDVAVAQPQSPEMRTQTNMESTA